MTHGILRKSRRGTGVGRRGVVRGVGVGRRDVVRSSSYISSISLSNSSSVSKRGAGMGRCFRGVGVGRLRRGAGVGGRGVVRLRGAGVGLWISSSSIALRLSL